MRPSCGDAVADEESSCAFTSRYHSPGHAVARLEWVLYPAIPMRARLVAPRQAGQLGAGADESSCRLHQQLARAGLSHWTANIGDLALTHEHNAVRFCFRRAQGPALLPTRSGPIAD